jgi:hypothetical protein
MAPFERPIEAGEGMHVRRSFVPSIAAMLALAVGIPGSAEMGFEGNGSYRR